MLRKLHNAQKEPINQTLNKIPIRTKEGNSSSCTVSTG